MRGRSLLFLVALSASVVSGLLACGSAGRSSEGADPAPPGAAPTGSAPEGTPPPPALDAGVATDDCKVGEAICLGTSSRRACVAAASAAASGGRWTDETCAAGSGCFKGACVPSRCSDECTLGDKNGSKTCAPFDIATGKPRTSDPATSTHDRARGYLARLRTESLASGRAADARARVRSLTQTMHLWLNVAGEPGMLVRWAKESSTTLPFAIGDLDCATERVHCGVDHAGKKYDFIGHISRDQYQGVMLGIALAYEALGSADEDLRELLRADAVTIVEELMKERSLPLKVTLNNAIPITAMVKARFLVVSPREMNGGALDLRLDLAKPNDSEMYGFQEFYPNLAHLVRQLPGLGWVPDVNRASSAMMLAAFFRVGLAVTDGVPAYAKRHADMLVYYTGHSGEGGNVNDWLAVAKQWTAGGSCGSGYYANNIAMMPMYDLARLEDDPSRSSVIENDILTAKMWPAFATTKNSFFSFIYAANKSGVDPSIASSAAAQLAQFPAAPRVARAVDLRSSGKYPSREQGCTDQVGHDVAVDVGDRVTADFLWQRHPWGLYEGGDPRQTEPGVDFLVAYFMGRQHDFIADDTPGTCLAWQ